MGGSLLIELGMFVKLVVFIGQERIPWSSVAQHIGNCALIDAEQGEPQQNVPMQKSCCIS